MKFTSILPSSELPAPSKSKKPALSSLRLRPVPRSKPPIAASVVDAGAHNAAGVLTNHTMDSAGEAVDMVVSTETVVVMDTATDTDAEDAEAGVADAEEPVTPPAEPHAAELFNEFYKTIQ